MKRRHFGFLMPVTLLADFFEQPWRCMSCGAKTSVDPGTSADVPPCFRCGKQKGYARDPLRTPANNALTPA